MFAVDLGGWLEFTAMAGFILANAAGVFVALIWALGMPTEDPTRPIAHIDHGAMTAAGVPYVPGPEDEAATR